MDSKALRAEQAKEQRTKIIGDYGAFLENNPTAGAIQDEVVLPYPKKTILNAIYYAIVENDNEAPLWAMEGTALLLAGYQQGVGDRPLSMLGLDFREGLSLPIKEMAARIANNPDAERYKVYASRVAEDEADILASLEVAKRLSRTHDLEQQLGLGSERNSERPPLISPVSIVKPSGSPPIGHGELGFGRDAYRLRKPQVRPKERVLVKVFNFAGMGWCGVVGILMILSLAMTAYREGFWAVTEMMSPFNVANYVVTVVVLAPGLLCLWGADKLSRRFRG